jgi:hypothetical protein
MAGHYRCCYKTRSRSFSSPHRLLSLNPHLLQSCLSRSAPISWSRCGTSSDRSHPSCSSVFTTARRRPARSRRHHHQPLRAARLQAHCYEARPRFSRAPREASVAFVYPILYAPWLNARALQTTLTLRASLSSPASSSTWLLVLSLPWSGRVSMPSRPAVSCLVLPTLLPLLLVCFRGIETFPPVIYV